MIPFWVWVIFYVCLGIVGAVILGFASYYAFMMRRHRRKVEILVYDNTIGQVVDKKHDRGGIYVRGGMKLFWLWKAKTGIKPEVVSAIPTSKGLVSYFIMPEGSKTIAPVSLQCTAEGFNMRIGEEDINYAIADYNRHKNALMGKGLLMQLLPYIIIAFIAVIVLIGFIYLTKKFDVLADVAASLDNAAQANKLVAERLDTIAQNLRPTTIVAGGS